MTPQPPSPPPPPSPPLPSLNPRSLEDIFNTSPIEMSDEELDLFIAHCREVRRKVLEAEASGKPRVGAKAPRRTAPPNSLVSIDDLLG